ncbi:ATP-binding cassette domain-containing protein [Bacillus nitroreducens]
MSLKIEKVDISPLLKDVNIQIEENSITSILGKNGSGKTTLLKVLSGLIIPNAGLLSYKMDFQIDYSNINIIKLNKVLNFLKKKVKYIPANIDLFENATVIQNIKYLLLVNNITLKDKETELLKYLNYFGLEGSLDKKIGSLSHGSKRKIVIICSLLFPNEYLILDEPTLGFDSTSTYNFFELIKKLNKTIIISTHEIEYAKEISTTIYHITDRVINKER